MRRDVVSFKERMCFAEGLVHSSHRIGIMTK